MFCFFICIIKLLKPSFLLPYLVISDIIDIFFTAVETILGFSGLRKLFHSDCRHVDNSSCIQFCKLSGHAISKQLYFGTKPTQKV